MERSQLHLQLTNQTHDKIVIIDALYKQLPGSSDTARPIFREATPSQRS